MQTLAKTSTRMSTRTPTLAVLIPPMAALTVTLAGCGSNDRSGTAVEVASTINYGSFGTTTEIDCGDGKSLNIGGSNNTLTLKGRCASVSVGGADNKITAARIDGELNVVGLNNSITYAAGQPTVNDTGTGNRIRPSR